MANEFIIRKGYKSLASSEITGSLALTSNITATGNLSVGSNPPTSAAIAADGNIKGTGYILLNSSVNEFIYATPTGKAVEIWASSSNASGDPAFRIRQDSAAKVDFGWDDEGTNDAFVWNYSNGGFKIGTNNSERFRITAAGNVGIGTTSPGASLHVNSGVIDNVARFESTDGSSKIEIKDSNDSVYVGTVAGTRMYLGFDPNGGTTDLAIRSDGSVGIGTTSPLHPLHVNGVISGSDTYINGWNSVSASLSTLTTDLDVLENKNLLSGSAQIASDISGSITSFSGSIAGRVKTNESSISSLNGATGSYLLNTTDTLTGNLTVTGTLTAQEFHTEFVSASILFDSGSTKFGDSSDDVHSFSGSLRVTGSGDHYFTDGKLVVGSTTSNYKFGVTGGHVGVSNGGNIYIGGFGADAVIGYMGNESGVFTLRSDGNRDVSIGSGTVNNSIFIEGSNGNVGIGTSTPLHPLHVVGIVSASAFHGDGSNLTGLVSSSHAEYADNATSSSHSEVADNVPYSGLTGTTPTWNQDTTGTAATASHAEYADNANTVDSKHATDFTLDYVTDNGATTTNNLSIGNLTTTGSITITDIGATRGIKRNNDAYDLRMMGGTSLDDGAYISLGGELRGGSGNAVAGAVEITQGGTNYAARTSISSSISFNAKSNAGTSTDLFIEGSSGNIGVGLTSPLYDLDVNGNIGVRGGQFHTNGSTDSYKFLSSTAAKAIRARSLQVSTSYSGTIPDDGILFSTDTNLYRSAANTLRTNDSLIVDNNLGIGITAPASKLHVSSSTFNDHITLGRDTDELGISVSGGQVLVEGGLSPFTNDAEDLGRADKHWQDLYITDNIYVSQSAVLGLAGGLNATGDLSGSDVYINDWGSVSASLASIDTDTNDIDYINAASFNTGNGVLTLSGVGNAGTTVDLDGRYPTLQTHRLQLSNGEISNFNGSMQMLIDANDGDSDITNYGDYAGVYPFGIYFTGDNDSATTTLGSGLVKVWHTGHFKKGHIDYLHAISSSLVTSTEFGYLDGVTSNIQSQLDAIVSSDIDGSGTANDIAMWSDSDTLTDAPIAISGNNATFAGNISAIGGTFTNPVTIYDVDATENPRLSIGRQAAESLQFDVEDTIATIRHKQDADSNAGHFLDFVIDSTSTGNKQYRFKQAGNTSSTYLTLDNSAATFTGNIHLDNDSSQLQFGDDNDMQIYHNGANGEINNTLGNFTIDSAGDITLDADGGDIRLYDGGVLYGNLANGAGHFQIKNPTQDMDISFIGNDGGSTVTALTLDMSEGGNATFAGIIKAANGSASAPSIAFSSDTDNGIYLEDYDAVNNKDQVSISTDGTRRFRANEAGVWSDNNFYVTGQYRKLVDDWWEGTHGVAGRGFRFRNTTDSTTPLSITSTGNGTFAGTVTAATSFIADAVSTSNNDPGTDNVQLSGYGMIGNRGNLYVTNANTDSAATVQIGVGGVHNGSPKLVVGATNSTFYTNVVPQADSTYSLGTTSLRWANIWADSINGLTVSSLVNGSGTANTIPKWSDSDTLTDSYLTQPSATTLKLSSDGSATAGTILELHFPNNNTTDRCATINFTNNIGGYAAIEGGTTGANNTGYIAFKVDNAGTQGETMRVLPNGNVGIGTTTVDGKLDIHGSNGRWRVNDYGSMYFRNDTDNSHENYIHARSNGDLSIGRVPTGSLSGTGVGTYADTTHDIVHIEAGGNVGIGTATPAVTLHANGFARFNGGIQLDGNNRTIYAIDNTDLLLGTNNAEKMRITAAGNVGINNTAATAKLHVLGTSTGNATTKAEMLSFSVFSVRPHNTNSGTLAIAQVDSGNSVGMQFTNGAGTANWDIALQPFGGNVGIGDVSPSYKLDVAGAGRFTSNLLVEGTLTETSAKRFKENIQPLESQLENIEKLNPVSFDWKKDGKSDIGLIAEEVKEIIPTLVSEEDGEVKGIQYTKLTAILIKAVQEQQKQINELKEEIFILKKK